jgi:glucose-1-phosphate cytidylyltransferase
MNAANPVPRHADAKGGPPTKVVILAGGRGSRLAEETSVRPKPMVEIGGRPILWHIMKIYAAHGLKDFVILLGYKGEVIKEFFLNYRAFASDFTVDLGSGALTMHRERLEDWRVTLVDTGEGTETGGRLKRARPYLDDDVPFCLTYGDGVADVDVGALLAFHRRHGLDATVTAAVPAARYGALDRDGDLVVSFREKPREMRPSVNGGFFVLSPRVIERIAGDDTSFEREPLEGLARDRQLAAFEHEGFWHPMDTLRDRMYLEDLWASGKAPWKTWT